MLRAFIAAKNFFWHQTKEVMDNRDEMLGTRGFKVDKVLNFAIDNANSNERIHAVWIHPSSG
ncbi:putative adenylate kinase [Helianthus annuus]|nr:putative adenylate kinase [Helianthus annuus]